MGKDNICVLIVESEQKALDQLTKALEASTLKLLIVFAADTDDAMLKVLELNPDIVFLEYPVKGRTGTGVIKFIQSKLPATTIVFVSSTIKYASEAIRFEVYDYLLKPIGKVELAKILEKVQIHKLTDLQSRIDKLIEIKQEDARLIFNTVKGFSIISSAEILYCKSDGAYTELHLANKSMELTYLTLSKVEEILAPFNFVRISRAILINKNYIRRILKTSGVFVLASNGVEYELKGSQKQIKALFRTEFE